MASFSITITTADQETIDTALKQVSDVLKTLTVTDTTDINFLHPVTVSIPDPAVIPQTDPPTMKDVTAIVGIVVTPEPVPVP